MSDLNDLLADVAEDASGPDLDAHTLVAAGRQRVQRRRTAWCLVSVLTVTIIVALAVPMLRDGDARAVDLPSSQITDEGPGAYREVELSAAEVERRCGATYGQDVTLVARESALVAQTVAFVRADTSTGQCIVPESIPSGGYLLVPNVSLGTSDPNALREACSQLTHYDFRGWHVAVESISARRASIELRSTNGYVATCAMNNRRAWLSIGSATP